MKKRIHPTNIEIIILDLVRENKGGFADEIEIDGAKYYIDVDAEVSSYEENGGYWAPDYDVYTIEDIRLNSVYALDEDGDELEDVEVIVDDNELESVIGEEF